MQHLAPANKQPVSLGWAADPNKAYAIGGQCLPCLQALKIRDALLQLPVASHLSHIELILAAGC